MTTTCATNRTVAPDSGTDRCVIFAPAVAPCCSRSRAASARLSSRHERRRRTCIRRRQRTPADAATTTTAESGLLFLDRHAFDTLAMLSEQIVPGSRAVAVPEFLDRLLAVESTDTQTALHAGARRLRA